MAVNGSEEERDINNIFDEIAFSEEQISNEAFQEGLIKGEEEGKVEGYHLGFHRGIQIGTEIGFYKGLIKVLSNNLDKITCRNNEKISNLLEKLSQQLDKFPKENCDDVDLTKAIDDIRANYKKLNSILKLNLSFPVTSNMSF